MQKNTEGVSLSDKEFEVTAMRDLLFDQGDNKVVAARTALDRMSGVPSKQFVEWLSEGALTKHDGQIVAADMEESNTSEESDTPTEEPQETAPEPQPAAS